MNLLYLDCFSGISGDMFVGALLDLGVSEKKLQASLDTLQLPDIRISSSKVVRQGISAVKLKGLEDVQSKEEHEHRHYQSIVSLIQKSGLEDCVKQRARNVFRRIGEAEAKVHGVPLEKIHFHEIGALDSIIDIVSACIAIELLGVENIIASPPRLGCGFVETAHGRYPVPGPATVELLKGVPIESSWVEAELVTPTGAALLAEFCSSFGPMPSMKIEQIGYGAGSRDLEGTPNVLRAVLGNNSTKHQSETDVVSVIETNLDDMNPEWIGDLTDRLFEAGSLDVFVTPVHMKKGRPGVVLTAICPLVKTDAIAEIVLTHSTTFGLRISEVCRKILDRKTEVVRTKFGVIEMKIGMFRGKIVSRAPEFESCRSAAVKAGVPLKSVYEEATRIAMEELS